MNLIMGLVYFIIDGINDLIYVISQLGLNPIVTFIVIILATIGFVIMVHHIVETIINIMMVPIRAIAMMIYRRRRRNRRVYTQ